MATVAEIHQAFDDASAQLLKEPRKSGSRLRLSSQDLDALRRLGFTNAKLPDNRDRLHEYALHYAVTYTGVNFISEDALNSICEKYGLIYAPADRYIGEIPVKNAKEIVEKAHIRDEDMEQVQSRVLRAERFLC
jgi:hypothetical protein